LAQSVAWLAFSIAVAAVYVSPWWLERRRSRLLRVVGAHPRRRDPVALIHLAIGVVFLVALYRAFDGAPVQWLFGDR